MATVTGSYSFTSSGINYIQTFRITYTIEDQNDRALVKVTKVEAKRNRTDSGPTTNVFYKSYYDSSLTWHGLEKFFTATFTWTTSYQTIFSGSSTITTYKRTSPYNITLCSACLIPITERTKYTITYSAPNASGVPDSTYKYYNMTAALASGKPTRTGYTFVNWKATNGTYYLPGASYTANAATTMTAQWTANKYTVIYDVNGGTGTVASQTKTYDTALNFQSGSTISRKETVSGIVREYELLKWNTNPDGTGTSYNLSSAIPNITSNLKVYAIWQLKYFYPKISNLQDYRTATSDILDDQRADAGEYIYITFMFTGYSDDGGSTYKVPSCKITIDDDEYAPILSFNTSSNTGECIFKPNVIYSKDNPHNIIIELYDPSRITTIDKAYDYITTAIYPIDLYSNDDVSEVYMGLMHPYVRDVPLSLNDTFIDGFLNIALEVDGNASESTDAVSGADKDLFNTIRHNGWFSSCMTNINNSYSAITKKLLSRIVAQSTAGTPIGQIVMYAGTTLPSPGWLWCRGQAVSRTTYSALYAVIEDTYGAGDGSTTFNVPNLQGRVGIGFNSTYPFGQPGGEATHTLTIDEMPSHGHTLVANSGSDFSFKYTWTSDSGRRTNTSEGSSGIGLTGGGKAHNNMPPYLAVNYIIYTGNI